MNYKIKVGKHYHSNLIARIKAFLNIFNKKRITKKVLFTEECWYPKNYVVNSGYNKLFGGGAILHQQTSARFVWMPNYEDNSKFQIFSYVYENGEWSDNYLCDISVGQWTELSIKIPIAKDSYNFIYPGGELNIPHHDPKLKKELQPYHGGRDYAYRTYNIKIKNKLFNL